MRRSLEQSLSYFNDRVSDCVKYNRSISVITHIDCDGIVSGSIITKSLIRDGARCTLRTVNEFNSNVIKNMKNDSRDMYIITDLGGQFSGELDLNLQDKWIILDHHQIDESEYDNERVINAWKYEINGNVEVCAGGMAYLASKYINKKNTDLAWLAVISALGDRQDQGEKKSFIGINSEIVDVAKNKKQLDVNLDLLFVGRETRSISNALASTSSPFIDGLTWNNDACLSLLNSAGINLKEGNKWRTPSELKSDEKQKIIEEIAKFTNSKNSTDITNELIGYVYTLPNEDKQSFLHDCREFSTMLNSCGRIKRSSIGIALCIGNRGDTEKGKNILFKYRKMLREQMNILMNERWRINSTENFIIVNGTDIIPETMTGTICSLIATSKNDDGKVVVVRTNGENDTIKFSLRKPMNCKQIINLSDLMKKCAKKVNCTGGGHNNAAGARIHKNKLDEFLDYLEKCHKFVKYK